MTPEEEYMEWVKTQRNKPMTNTQSNFARWLFEPSQEEMIAQIGDLDSIFTSVRYYLKHRSPPG